MSRGSLYSKGTHPSVNRLEDRLLLFSVVCAELHLILITGNSITSFSLLQPPASWQITQVTVEGRGKNVQTRARLALQSQAEGKIQKATDGSLNDQVFTQTLLYEARPVISSVACVVEIHHERYSLLPCNCMWYHVIQLTFEAGLV